jgi:uncharacterized protein YndB with AHSA1/START domain
VVTIEREVAVAATPERVWAVLQDVESWPEWTASMTSVQRAAGGPLRVGEQVRVRQPRLPRTVWTVTRVEPGRSFSWSASTPGVRTTADHEIHPGPDGCRVVLRLVQAGPLAAPIDLLLGRMVRRYVDLEAEGLRRRAGSA